MRAAFFGSPAFAVPCLDALTRVADVVAVFSQPDRPAGRGMKLRPPAVKVRALELGLPVHQPKKMRDGAVAEQLRSLALDVALVVAYGRILPRPVLDAPRMGCVNVHASLLPRWRGAAPIQWAIASGDERTGVSLMKLDEGMDTGPVVTMDETPIEPNETTADLAERLSAMGAAMVERDLAGYVRGELEPKAQAGEASHARLLTKEDGRLDFRWTAQRVHDRVRAMHPWPGAYTTDQGERLKVHRSRLIEADGVRGTPGEVIATTADGLHVACAKGVVALVELQQPGRKRLAADAFVAGRGTPERLGDDA
jgi:methionyl-tRNA formyltransferase